MTDETGEQLGFLVPPLFLVIIALVAVFVISYDSRYSSKRNLSILRFAIDNDLHYTTDSEITPPKGPLMFSIGYDRKQIRTLIFPDLSMFALYEYTVESGKSRATHSLEFMSMMLPRRVPHLLLNSKRNMVSVPVYNYQVQKIELEGDFNKYFTVYAPPNYHVDALQILTPDVMQAFIKYGQKYDFELIGNKLYAYRHPSTKTWSAAGMREALTGVANVASQIREQTDTYRDARINGAVDIVAPDGMRFKIRPSWQRALIVILIVLFCYLMDYLIKALF
ncbi:MAG: DUF3137 domain-containing protein [Candidatus Nomurabacteria bacterium]|nr:DUF3137 domain-containing protein [Candidatus Nomurabacteria bacterium]